MEKLNDSLNFISKLGDGLNGLSGFALTVLACLTVGFVVKKWFALVPNERIPTIVIFVGALLNVALAEARPETYPLRVWIVRNAIVGGLAGWLAWGIHTYRSIIPGFDLLMAQVGGKEKENLEKKD